MIQNFLTNTDNAFENIGISLRKCANKILPISIATVSILSLIGCSPKYKSLLSGSYTNIPSPPAAARIQVGVSTESNGDVLINYICWDKDNSKFVRRDVHYTTGNWTGIGQSNEFQEKGGYLQSILNGEVLSGGIIVDQRQGRLTLPNGYYIEGPTGSIIDKEGKVVTTLDR